MDGHQLEAKKVAVVVQKYLSKKSQENDILSNYNTYQSADLNNFTPLENIERKIQSVSFSLRKKNSLSGHKLVFIVKISYCFLKISR